MTPEQARALRAEVDAVSKQARDLTTGLDFKALTKRPVGGGWSVAENLQHLILTSSAMLPLAENAIAELERGQKKALGPASLGFIGWLLVKSLEPPSRMKTRTAKPFEPAVIPDPSTLLAQFQEANTKLGDLIARASGLETTRVKVASPFNASVKYNLYAALRIIVVHERRHLFQAAQASAAA